MTFERGIWRGAYDNARVNIWLLLMITAAIFVLYLASDLGRLKSGGSFSIIIWAYLAIPAHFTALTGEPGIKAVGGRKLNTAFLWRAGVLSFAGLLGVICAVPFLRTASSERSLGIMLLFYALAEIFILGFLGTWLPSVVAEGDKTLKRASYRGAKIFWYVVLRLVSCNGLVLLFGLIIFSLLLSHAGDGKIWSTAEGTNWVAATAYMLMSLAISIHVVLLATILSRAYLIAEGKVPTSEQSFKDQVKDISANVGKSTWSSFLTTLNGVKWVVLITILLIAANYQLAKTSNNDLYLLCPLPFILLPLAFSSSATILTSRSGFWPINWQAIRSVWFPFAWRSIALTFIGAAPAICLYWIHIPMLSPELRLAGLSIVYAVSETLLIAKLGTVLESIFANGDRSLSAASLRGAITFRHVLTRLWFYNVLTLLGTFAAGSLLYLIIGIVVDFAAGRGQIEALRPFLEVLFFIPLVAMTVMSAVITSRAYLIADMEKASAVASASSS